MADPVVHISGGIPDLGTGNITTLGLTIPPAGTTTTTVQGGPMAQGAVTTSPPLYTTGQVNPLSLTTGGLLRVDGTGGTFPISGSIGITGTVACTQSGPWNIGSITTLPALPANQSVNVAQINGITPLMGNGTTGTGSQRVTIASDNTPFSVNAAQSGAWTVQRIQNANSTGLTQTRVVAAATTNATSLKASAGNIAAIDLFNVATYMVFLKLYNKASAPTVGTDTPVWTIPIPASGGFSIDFSQGEYFSTGIAFAITKLQADSDTTVLVAGDVTGRIKWV